MTLNPPTGEQVRARFERQYRRWVLRRRIGRILWPFRR